MKWHYKDNYRYYELKSLNLNHPDFHNLHGNYIIWKIVRNAWNSGRSEARAVYVGSGNIPSRLGDHREDRRIQFHALTDTLYVTWRKESLVGFYKGIEAYLFQTLIPLVGERTPNTTPLHVNLPPLNWIKFPPYLKSQNIGITDLCNNNGVAKCEQGYLDQGIMDFDLAILLDSNNAMAYLNRGSAKRQKGLTTSGNADLRKAWEIYNKNTASRWNLPR